MESNQSRKRKFSELSAAKRPPGRPLPPAKRPPGRPLPPAKRPPGRPVPPANRSPGRFSQLGQASSPLHNEDAVSPQPSSSVCASNVEKQLESRLLPQPVEIPNASKGSSTNPCANSRTKRNYNDLNRIPVIFKQLCYYHYTNGCTRGYTCNRAHSVTHKRIEDKIVFLTPDELIAAYEYARPRSKLFQETALSFVNVFGTTADVDQLIRSVGDIVQCDNIFNKTPFVEKVLAYLRFIGISLKTAVDKIIEVHGSESICLSDILLDIIVLQNREDLHKNRELVQTLLTNRKEPPDDSIIQAIGSNFNSGGGGELDLRHSTANLRDVNLCANNNLPASSRGVDLRENSNGPEYSLSQSSDPVQEESNVNSHVVDLRGNSSRPKCGIYGVFKSSDSVQEGRNNVNSHDVDLRGNSSGPKCDGLFQSRDTIQEDRNINSLDVRLRGNNSRSICSSLQSRDSVQKGSNNVNSHDIDLRGNSSGPKPGGYGVFQSRDPIKEDHNVNSLDVDFYKKSSIPKCGVYRSLQSSDSVQKKSNNVNLHDVDLRGNSSGPKCGGLFQSRDSIKDDRNVNSLDVDLHEKSSRPKWGVYGLLQSSDSVQEGSNNVNSLRGNSSGPKRGGLFQSRDSVQEGRNNVDSHDVDLRGNSSGPKRGGLFQSRDTIQQARNVNSLDVRLRGNNSKSIYSSLRSRESVQKGGNVNLHDDQPTTSEYGLLQLKTYVQEENYMKIIFVLNGFKNNSIEQQQLFVKETLACYKEKTPEKVAEMLFQLFDGLEHLYPDYMKNDGIKNILSMLAVNIIGLLEAGKLYKQACNILLKLRMYFECLKDATWLHNFHRHNYSESGKILYFCKVFVKGQHIKEAWLILKQPEFKLLYKIEKWALPHKKPFDSTLRDCVLKDLICVSLCTDIEFAKTVILYVIQDKDVTKIDIWDHFNKLVSEMVKNKIHRENLKSLLNKILEGWYKNVEKPVMRALLVGLSSKIPDITALKLYKTCCKKNCYPHVKGNETTLSLNFDLSSEEIRMTLHTYFYEKAKNCFELNDLTILIHSVNTLPETKIFSHDKMIKTVKTKVCSLLGEGLFPKAPINCTVKKDSFICIKAKHMEKCYSYYLQRYSGRCFS